MRQQLKFLELSGGRSTAKMEEYFKDPHNLNEMKTVVQF
jgi:hypothetical protein